MVTDYCPECGAGSDKARKRGRGQLECKKCGRYYSEGMSSASQIFTHNVEKGIAVMDARVPRIMNDQDLIRFLHIDMKTWKVDKIIYGKHEGFRKDRKGEIKFNNGKMNGWSKDSGKVKIAQLFSVKIFLVRRVQEMRAEKVMQTLLKDAKKQSKVVGRFAYPKYKDGFMYEIFMPDIHFGRLTWMNESNENYDIKIAAQVVDHALMSLLYHVQNYPISKILLPVGNDFFNADNKEGTTTHGTPQQEDTRWPKTFTAGRRLLTHVIDTCKQIAPVDVMVVVGNHDEQRMFYLGEVLDAQFFNDKNVKVDNRFLPRKYHSFGRNLICFTHGYWERPENLPMRMAIEARKEWANTIHAEVHLGDKHHKKEMTFLTEDVDGVTIRYCRSLAGDDAWTFNKGFTGTPKGSEGFLWHKQEGMVGQFPAVIPAKFYK